jgi:hypothetical protein
MGLRPAAEGPILRGRFPFGARGNGGQALHMPIHPFPAHYTARLRRQSSPARGISSIQELGAATPPPNPQLGKNLCLRGDDRGRSLADDRRRVKEALRNRRLGARSHSCIDGLGRASWLR